jgi:hypothetical protein
MSRFTARCSCGAIRCAIDAPLDMVVNCHCTDCRRMNGSAFSSMVVAPANAVEVTEGASGLATYALTEAATKHFCTRCGTPLFNTNSRFPAMKMIYLGVIDGHERLAPSFNAYCRSKLGWVDRIPELTSFAATPGG